MKYLDIELAEKTYVRFSTIDIEDFKKHFTPDNSVYPLFENEGFSEEDYWFGYYEKDGKLYAVGSDDQLTMPNGAMVIKRLASREEMKQMEQVLIAEPMKGEVFQEGEDDYSPIVPPSYEVVGEENKFDNDDLDMLYNDMQKCGLKPNFTYNQLAAFLSYKRIEYNMPKGKVIYYVK